MAVRTASINYPSNNVSVAWSGLLNGDTGLPVYAADYPEKTFQTFGTFGVGGTVILEASNDGGTTWAAMHTRQGANLSFTAAGLTVVGENPLLIRPRVTAGDGTTSLTVIVTGAQVLLRTERDLAPATGGPLFALLGDSITEFCSGSRIPPETNPIQIWRNDGYAAWLRILSGQRIRLPIANNFGVSGDRLDQMAVRIPTVIGTGAQFVIVVGGTNDITQGTTFDNMKATWLNSIITPLVGAGITPVVCPIPPRGDALSATQYSTQARFNRFLAEYALAHPEIMFVNWNKYLVDQASANNAPIAGRMRADGIHPAIAGGYYMGLALHEVLSTVIPPSPTSMVDGFRDAYNATTNPTGNLMYFGNFGFGNLFGTGGTATASAGLTYATSDIADALQHIRGTSTSTCTVTLTKENPRIEPDRSSGERQIIQIAAAGDGGTDEIYNFRYGLDIADIQAGDWIYGEAEIEVSAAPVRVRSLEFNIFEDRPANDQNTYDNGSSDALSGFLPAVTWKGVFRTEPIQRQSDTTGVQANIRARLNTSGSAASITIKIGDMAVRKIKDL